MKYTHFKFKGYESVIKQNILVGKWLKKNLFSVIQSMKTIGIKVHSNPLDLHSIQSFNFILKGLSQSHIFISPLDIYIDRKLDVLCS